MISAQEKYCYITQVDYEAVAGPDWPPFSSFATHQSVPDFVYTELDTMLAPPMEFDHPSFCVLPFYGYEYPQNTPCCLLPRPHNRQHIQEAILNRQRHSACQKCWTLEDAGLTSDRMIKNSTLDFFYKKNIQNLYNDCKNGNFGIIHYKIDTNNVCNLTCVTCGSKSSSAWAKLEQDNGVSPKRTWQINPEKINSVIDYTTAKSIVFRGGEPFMSKTNWYILEQLIAHGNTDCFVSFTTNGSFKLTNRQQTIVQQFSNINFCFSIDGVGPVFEYLRYPADFDTIQFNIEWCKQHNVMPSVSYTVSNLNILYHSQTLNWFNQNNLNYIINPVYYPVHFKPSSLPQSVKQHIIDANTIDVSSFLGHCDLDDINFTRFKAEITKQDSWKNISINDYLPELVKLISN